MATTRNPFEPLMKLGNNTQPMTKRRRAEDMRVKRLGLQAGESEMINANEKFIIMKNADENNDLSKFSPFYIQKALDMITTGIVKTQRTRAGELLILAKNSATANSLLKATKLGQLVQIKVIEHPTLNSSKGMIFCRDLMDINEEDILEGLKEQGVVEVRKIKRWVDNKLKDTPSIVLTFNTPALPEHIKAGFLRLEVRRYIPNPMKCTNCLRFGHTKKRCTSTVQICIRCSEGMPHSEDCTVLKCVNCGQKHAANSKICPVYQREAAIVKIKTEDRLTFYEAKSKYYRLYANTTPATNTGRSFAEIVKSSTETQRAEAHQPETIVPTTKIQVEEQQTQQTKQQQIKQEQQKPQQQTQMQQQQHLPIVTPQPQMQQQKPLFMVKPEQIQHLKHLQKRLQEKTQIEQTINWRELKLQQENMQQQQQLTQQHQAASTMEVDLNSEDSRRSAMTTITNL